MKRLVLLVVLSTLPCAAQVLALEFVGEVQFSATNSSGNGTSDV